MYVCMYVYVLMIWCFSIDSPAGPNEFVKVPAGKAMVGKPTSFPSYGWDNEYGKAEME